MYFIGQTCILLYLSSFLIGSGFKEQEDSALFYQKNYLLELTLLAFLSASTEALKQAGEEVW